ncbi:S8 family serine peptidase [Tahibacter sp. UC22_41]|uniref:S8 family serine peptidase n=1 Tax=Tahibacter sp. UC22_41 TaxID=3350178 RepID=UPI0036DC8D92
MDRLPAFSSGKPRARGDRAVLRSTGLAAALAAALTAAAMPRDGLADSRRSVSAATATPASVQADIRDPRRLLWRAGSYDPRSEQLNLRALTGVDAVSTHYAVIQFEPAHLQEGRRHLEQAGVTIVGYVPNNAYLVRLGTTPLQTLAADPIVRAADYLAAGLKIDPRLWPEQRGLLAMQRVATVDNGEFDVVQLRGHAGESAQAIAAAVRKIAPDARILAVTQRRDAEPGVRVAVARERLDALLAQASRLDAVAALEPWIPTLLDNAGSVSAIQANAMGSCAGNGAVCGPTPIWAQGLLGSGQIVAVYDSGTTPWSARFTTLDRGNGPSSAITYADDPPPLPPATGNLYPDRKIVAYWLQAGYGPTVYDYYARHGTHVSGTLLGDLAGTFNGNTYLASTPDVAHHDAADGMAPNAQLLMQDAGGTDPNAIFADDLAASLEQAHAGGARIHNDSWGSATRGNYVDLDAAADQVTWAAEDLLVVAAAGNSGPTALTIGSPGNAKNVLTVGALGHAGSIEVPWWSSRGPAADGRRKPDIAAPGQDIWSASASLFSSVAQYSAPLTMSGTSMAAPAISGAAALARQYFRDGFYPRGRRSADDAYTPSGAVMKAVLLNGTHPVGLPTWPNTDSGWGRAWLDGNLWFAQTAADGDDTRRLRIVERPRSAGMTTGDVHEYTISQIGDRAELRATLTWFDPPAAPGVAAALVNDLDLELVAPDGRLYRGNAMAAGVSVADGTADRLNTVEQIRLPQPLPGAWRLRIRAAAVPGNGDDGSDRQGYALAVSGDFALPDPPPAPAPDGIAVVGNGSDGITVDFAAVTAAQSFQLYRADGSCADAERGDFRLVAHGDQAPLHDATTQGGRRYAYRLRAVRDDVEGHASACVDVVSADDCTLRPAIARDSLTLQARNASCSVQLAWQPAAAVCAAAGTALRYRVERSEDPFMAGARIVAQDLAATSYVDTDVVDGKAYYYRFSATDGLGNDSPYSAIAGATTSGTAGPDPAVFRDDADTTSHLLSGRGWALSSLAAADGRYSHHTGGQAAQYGDLQCTTIETPLLKLPARAQLAFSARYNLEYAWDGVVTEISTDGGANWNDLPPVGGYPTTLQTGQLPPINACGFADGKGVYSGVSTTISYAAPGNDTAVAVFKPFVVDLAAYAGLDAKIRWRLSSDPAYSYSGFFLDSVRIGDPDRLFRSTFETSAHVCR